MEIDYWLGALVAWEIGNLGHVGGWGYFCLARDFEIRAFRERPWTAMEKMTMM